MSLAGIRSNRGDAYQRAIALYWTVKMLLDDKIDGVQFDAISLPDQDYPVYGDDIVILFKDNHKRFIQAKVNQTNHESWRLTDTVLKKELVSAKKQLLTDSNCDFYFYSRTPFHTLQRLIEEANLYSSYQAFLKNAHAKQKKALEDISIIWEIVHTDAYDLVKRLNIGEHHSFEQWLENSLFMIQHHFSQPQTCIELIYNYVDRQHSKLGESQYVTRREDVTSMLEKHGIHHIDNFNEKKTLEIFKTFSQQGRQWIRTIGGLTIERSELKLLKQFIDAGRSTVLLEDIAGGGKTCILLDLIDFLEENNNVATLFIRGDLFASIQSMNDLADFGLPGDFIPQCVHLAEKKKVVIVIDSLDVLAVGRSHKSLQSFLGLIANLAPVPNITIIAASRSFDAKYDPLLRETSWDETIQIKPLSFDNDIAPFIIKQNFDPSNLSLALKKHLIIPQNLRLFFELLQKGVNPEETEGHDLYDLYIQELIENDEILGSEIVSRLQTIASNLLIERSYKFPKNQLHASSKQYQRLLSQNLVLEAGFSQLMFSHQTLADALRIRKAQRDNIDLQTFIISQPQLPFIRPAVRSFILSLRTVQADRFTKQFRQFLQNSSISMHIKRLGVESLAEMSARDSDLSILTILAYELPDLFNRFLCKAIGDDWFSLIYNHLLPKINTHEDKDIAVSLLHYFPKFMKGNEELLINIWICALDEEWLPPFSLAWSISSDLFKMSNWNNSNTYFLLEKLFDASDNERDGIGRAICKYVNETGHGDELLWRYIIRDTLPVTEIKFGRQLKFNCDEHDLLKGKFFEQRLKSSDVLFSLTIEYLLNISKEFVSEDGGYPFESLLLHDTSFRKRHSYHDTNHTESIHVFFEAIEGSLKSRSSENDESWVKHEPFLRQSKDLAIRYLLCEAYLTNIQDNLDGISYQLNDENLLQYGDLEYELGILTKAAYPYLSNETHEKHQNLILRLYNEIYTNEDRKWIIQKKYEYLICIPCSYRLKDVNCFINKHESLFGNYLPEPHIHSHGGWVRSPVSSNKLLELNNRCLLRLIQHYSNYNEWTDRTPQGLTGGCDVLVREIASAASYDPMKFISLSTLIANSYLAYNFLNPIIEGISTHLQCRFGNLHNPEWKAIEPFVDGKIIANRLLDIIEKFCINDFDQHTTARALQACAFILHDDISLERLYFHFWRLGLSENPDEAKDDEAESLIGRGINSVRGITAESLLIICNDRLENELPITDELHKLLVRYAKDPSMVVRATFLRRFTNLHFKEPELGWELAELITEDSKPRLLKHLEQTLYYQYHSNYERVKPYLNMLLEVKDSKSAEAWGRLATLSYLSGHIDEAQLWNDVNNHMEAAKEGMGQVFVANITSHKSSAFCIKGLSILMETRAPKPVFSNFERSLDKDEQIKFVPLSLIELFIKNAPANHIREIDGTFSWLEKNVLSKPYEVLSLLELLIERFKEMTDPIYFHSPDALITTLKLLLQEADLNDDSIFINKVLHIQDWFLDHNLNELETFLNTEN